MNCPKCNGKGWIFKGHGEDEQCDCQLVDPPLPTTHELFTKARLLNIDVLERLKAHVKDGLSEDASVLMEVSLHLRLCEERLEALSHAEQMRVVCDFMAEKGPRNWIDYTITPIQP